MSTWKREGAGVFRERREVELGGGGGGEVVVSVEVGEGGGWAGRDVVTTSPGEGGLSHTSSLGWIDAIVDWTIAASCHCTGLC